MSFRHSQPAPTDLLPLPPHVFQILLALYHQGRHGYGLIEEIRRQSGDRITLGTSTVYAALQRMRRLGLIEDAPPPADADSEDARRRYYQTTALGDLVVKAEAERIRQLHRTITASGVLGTTSSRGSA